MQSAIRPFGPLFFLMTFLSSLSAAGFELAAEPVLSPDGESYNVRLCVDGIDESLHRVTFRRRIVGGPSAPLPEIKSSPPFVDESVPPGKAYEYEAAIHLENGTRLGEVAARATTPPDLKLTGETKLTDDSTVRAGRVRFSRAARVTLGGRRYNLTALALSAEDADLRSWAEREGAGKAGTVPLDKDARPVPGGAGGDGERGRDQGEVSVQALSARGLLRVTLQGGAGGDGAQGTQGLHGMPGASGFPGSFETHPERGYITRREHPTNGGPGEKGGAGGPGGRGGNGGDVHRAFLLFSDADEMHCLLKVEGGSPGLGGLGGRGGRGGPGGPPGACPERLRPASQGPNGEDGAGGKRGDDGEKGKKAACLRVSDRKEGDCDER